MFLFVYLLLVALVRISLHSLLVKLVSQIKLKYKINQKHLNSEKKLLTETVQNGAVILVKQVNITNSYAKPLNYISTLLPIHRC